MGVLRCEMSDVQMMIIYGSWLISNGLLNNNYGFGMC